MRRDRREEAQTREGSGSGQYGHAADAPEGSPSGAPELVLPVPEEFRFARNVEYLSRSPKECMFYVSNGRIRRVIPAGTEEPVVELLEDREGIRLRFPGYRTPLNSRTQAEVTRYVREWFDLDTDLAPFYRMAEADSLLRDAARRFYGLRNIGIPDLFEAVCWGIIGQQINLSFAYTLKRRFVETFGRYIEQEGIRYWVFPSPQQIASLDVSDLTELQMSAKKSEYLIHAAGLMAERKLAKELLLDLGDCKAAERHLTAIRGIGPWTANYVLMRCLRYPSAFPIDDAGLHNAIRQVRGMDRKPTCEEIRKLSSGWTNWESYAVFYLWRCLY